MAFGEVEWVFDEPWGLVWMGRDGCEGKVRGLVWDYEGMFGSLNIGIIGGRLFPRGKRYINETFLTIGLGCYAACSP